MKFCALLFAVIFLSACEKDVTLKLDDAVPLLVVDGQIEDGQPPIIVLTKSLGYFSKIDAQTLTGTFVRNAEVFISNGILTHKLKEYATPLAPGFTGYFYSNDNLNPSTAFLGQLNKNIQLKSSGRRKGIHINNFYSYKCHYIGFYLYKTCAT